MLRIEIDLFSGRPNPAWYVTEDQSVKSILDAAKSERGAIAEPGAGFNGLGLREVRVATLGDEGSRIRGVPAQFAVASTAARDPTASCDLARRLVEAMPLRSGITLVEHALTPLTAALRDMVLEQIGALMQRPGPPKPPPPPKPTSNPLIDTTKDAKCQSCEYEISQFNPAFWNDASQPNNNCYNYARNWKTNTFAQPGRAHGAGTNVMQCNTVTTAAMADGLKKRCNPCLPLSEFPRRLMALVIWPGHDYHWYRHQRGGFWGHKPGQTAARNYDNSSVVITNPETCNRGNYVNFCDYFYAGKSVVIN